MNISFVFAFLSFICILSPDMKGATRSEIQRKDRKTDQPLSNSQPQIILVPVNMTQQQPNQSQQDTEFFNTLLGIASNFGNILLDPHNSPAVVNNVGNMIHGIIQAAQIITKYQNRTPSIQELSLIIGLALQEQVKQKKVHAPKLQANL